MIPIKPPIAVLNIDFNRFGFAPGEIKRRDYGGAGLSYPDALFRNKIIFRGRHVEKVEKLDPQTLAVQDTVRQGRRRLAAGSPATVVQTGEVLSMRHRQSNCRLTNHEARIMREPGTIR